MPETIRSAFRRVLSSQRSAVIAASAIAGLTTIAAVTGLAAAGVVGTNAAGSQHAFAGEPTPAPTRVGQLQQDTTARDAWQYAASLITPTNTPTETPTWTPVPPTPTSTPLPARPAAPRPQQPSAPPPTRPAPPPPTPPPPAPRAAGLNTAPMGAFEQALFDATNARRLANGLPALRPNPNLVGVARVRSQEMATYDYFSHDSPITGHNAFSLMDLYGVPYAWAGENLAKNNYPDAETVGVADEALWNSPPHRANILGAHYTDMGIGFAVDANEMKYFTIIFTGP